MSDLKETVRRVIEAAESPAILCSWGKDSSLLLHHARHVKPDIAVYFFGDSLPELAAQMIVKQGLAVQSFLPRWSCVIDSTLIDEYFFNGIAMPMLSSVTANEDCQHGHMKSMAADFYFPQDLLLWGYRRADSHPLLPDIKFEREIQMGHSKLVAPLYDLTTDQVLNALDVLNLEYADDEPVLVCEDCMNALISNATTLAGFQERQLNH